MRSIYHISRVGNYIVLGDGSAFVLDEVPLTDNFKKVSFVTPIQSSILNKTPYIFIINLLFGPIFIPDRHEREGTRRSDRLYLGKYWLLFDICTGIEDSVLLSLRIKTRKR